MAKKTSVLKAPKLAVHRETLRRLSDADLANAAGGAASGTCENRSFGFLCDRLCGASRSCKD